MDDYTKQTKQTLEHLVAECPAFGKQRLEHENLCDYFQLDPYKLTTLVGKHVAIESFIRFTSHIIDHLKRFNNT